MKAQIFDPTVDTLATLVEEGARANSRSTDRFIEPAEGTLRRATTRRHHIIFGRRGSGKSSLLFKSAETLQKTGRPIAYVDLEPFKGHHYPDLLISALLATFNAFLIWLLQHNFADGYERRWYTAFIWKTPTAKGHEREKLIDSLNATITELKAQLHSADGAALKAKTSYDEKSTQTASAKGKASGGVPGASKAEMESSFSNVSESKSTGEQQEEYKRSKQDYLNRKIIDFQNIFRRFTTLTNGDCFLFLDDLYHIYRSDQPQLIDYFHRIAKGNNLWLKIGSIRHRSTWYANAPQPTGLKLGDDADEINLDLTLEKFSVSREFLRAVISTYIKEAKSPELGDLVAEGGLDRLVLASGGVTRDFLGLFRRSIDEVRERLQKGGEHARGEKIGAEDVNRAAGGYGETKMEEFRRDTLEDRQRLEDALHKIYTFCLQKTESNIFLIDQDLQTADYDLVQELVDLRLIHHVKSRVTVSGFTGKNFRALLLDVSQYSGERKKRNVEMLEFWKDANKEALRRRSRIYDPDRSLVDLEREVAEKKDRDKPASSGSDQGQLF